MDVRSLSEKSITEPFLTRRCGRVAVSETRPRVAPRDCDEPSLRSGSTARITLSQRPGTLRAHVGATNAKVNVESSCSDLRNAAKLEKYGCYCDAKFVLRSGVLSESCQSVSTPLSDVSERGLIDPSRSDVYRGSGCWGRVMSIDVESQRSAGRLMLRR